MTAEDGAGPRKPKKRKRKKRKNRNPIDRRRRVRVKVLSSLHNRDALRRTMVAIVGDGTPVVETDLGPLGPDAIEDVEQIPDDWLRSNDTFDEDARFSPIVAFHLRLSMTGKIQKRSFRAVTRQFLQEAIGEREYVMAVHGDEAPYYAHVALQARDMVGALFDPTAAFRDLRREVRAKDAHRRPAAARLPDSLNSAIPQIDIAKNGDTERPVLNTAEIEVAKESNHG